MVAQNLSCHCQSGVVDALMNVWFGFSNFLLFYFTNNVCCSFTLKTNVAVSAIVALMIIVFAIEPKVRVFNPGRGRWIFKVDKNP
jgi:hypothetical protein